MPVAISQHLLQAGYSPDLHVPVNVIEAIFTEDVFRNRFYAVFAGDTDEHYADANVYERAKFDLVITRLRDCNIEVSTGKFADDHKYCWATSYESIVDTRTRTYTISFNRDIFESLAFFRSGPGLDPVKVQLILTMLYFSAVHQFAHILNFYCRPQDSPETLNGCDVATRIIKTTGKKAGEAGYAMEQIIFGGVAVAAVHHPVVGQTASLMDISHLIFVVDRDSHFALSPDICTALLNSMARPESVKFPLWKYVDRAKKQNLRPSAAFPYGTMKVRGVCGGIQATLSMGVVSGNVAVEGGLMILMPSNEEHPSGMKT